MTRMTRKGLIALLEAMGAEKPLRVIDSEQVTLKLANKLWCNTSICSMWGTWHYVTHVVVQPACLGSWIVNAYTPNCQVFKIAELNAYESYEKTQARLAKQAEKAAGVMGFLKTLPEAIKQAHADRYTDHVPFLR